MEESLLTRIALTVGSRQGENVATAALVFMLQSYPAANRAFIELIGERSGLQLSRDLFFVPQQAKGDGGITDISGFRAGSEEIIVEAKIRAQFGPRQVTKYIERLQSRNQRLPGARAILVVLAPAARARQLFERACEEVNAAISPASFGMVHRPGAEVRIAYITWTDVLAALERAVGPAGSQTRAAYHADEIGALYRHIEGRTVMPLSEEQVSADTGRALLSCVELMDRVAETIQADRGSGCTFGNFTSGRWSFGYWGTVGIYRAWWGVWLRPWADHAGESATPYWLQLQASDHRSRQDVVNTIRSIGDGGIVIPPDAPGQKATEVRVALVPRLKVDEDMVVDGLVQQLRQIAAALGGDSLVSPGDEEDAIGQA